jgi:predicted ATP-dependent serine protease
VRSVRRLEQRLAEAAVLGLEIAVIPDEGDIRVPPGLEVRRAAGVRQALEILGIAR